MNNVDWRDKNIRCNFERHIEHLVALDAGASMIDPDQPMHEFLDILIDTSRNPIESEDHLQILRQGIDHIMTDPAEPSGSLQDAMDDALHKAILEAQTPMQGALLALARYAIMANRLDLVSA